MVGEDLLALWRTDFDHKPAIHLGEIDIKMDLRVWLDVQGKTETAIDDLGTVSGDDQIALTSTFI